MENPFVFILNEIKELRRVIEQICALKQPQDIRQEQEFLPLEEVATLLGMSKSTLYKYSSSRNSPLIFYKVGKKLFCKRQEIMEYIAKSKIMRPQDYANQQLTSKKRSG